MVPVSFVKLRRIDLHRYFKRRKVLLPTTADTEPEVISDVEFNPQLSCTSWRHAGHVLSRFRFGNKNCNCFFLLLKSNGQ